MLMQYFTYDELKDIKKQVIAQHCSQQQLDCAAEVLKGFRLWSQAEELQKAFKYSDHEKTDYGSWAYSQMLQYFCVFKPVRICVMQKLFSSSSSVLVIPAL